VPASVASLADGGRARRRQRLPSAEVRAGGDGGRAEIHSSRIQSSAARASSRKPYAATAGRSSSGQPRLLCRCLRADPVEE
jgi:hypothetical protein